MNSTPRKRILVLRNNLAFNAGVQYLLSEQKMLEVIGMEVQSQDDLFQNIDQVRPDVIILDDGFLAANLAALVTYLQKCPMRRTLILSLTENQIQVYDTKQIPIQQLGDFLTLVDPSDLTEMNE